MRYRFTAYIMLTVLACAVAGQAAFAQTIWPMYGHDPQRTGQADNNALVGSKPVPMWTWPYPEEGVEPVDDDYSGGDPNFGLSGPDWREGVPELQLRPDAYDGDFLCVETSSLTETHSASWTFPLAEQVNWMVAYYVYVWFPSFTPHIELPNMHSEDAEYVVEIRNDDGSTASVESFTVDQNAGGTWIPLTSNAFMVREDQYVVVRLTNRTRAAPSLDIPRIVVADAVRLEQDAGTVLSSPVVSREHDIVLTCVTQNRPLETVEITGLVPGEGFTLQSGSRFVGVVCGIATEDDLGTAGQDERGIPQWWFPYNWDNWIEGGFSSSPTVANVAGVGEVAYVPAGDGQVYALKTARGIPENERLAWRGPGYVFEDPTHASGWGQGTHPGYQGSGYRQAPAIAAGSSGEVSAFWSVELESEGRYAFYVWIPPSTSAATYISDADYTLRIGPDDAVVRVDQGGSGGQWVRLGSQWIVHSDDRMDVSVRLTNVTNQQSATEGRYVAADALKVVPADLGSFDFSSPAVSSDGRTIYVGSTSGRVYAFGFGDPDPVWTYPHPEENQIGAIYASPALSVDGATLYVGSADGHVYALKTTASNLSDPDRLRWVYPSKDPTDGGPLQILGEISSTAAVGDKIYVGVGSSWWSTGFDFDTSGRVIALTQDGKPDWTYPAEGAESRGAFLYSSPLLFGDRVVIGSTDGYLYALDRDTGDELWERADLRHSIYSSPAGVTISSENYLPMAYVGTEGGTLYGVDLREGNKHWWYHLLGAVTSSPALCGGRLYVGDAAGVTWAFSSLAGEGWITGPGRPDEPPGSSSEEEEGKGRAEPEVDIFTEEVFHQIVTDEDGADIRFDSSSGTFDAADGDLHNVARTHPNSPDVETYEWGETIYIVVWNLLEPNPVADDGTRPKPRLDPDFKGKTDSNVRLTFQSRAPGDQSDQSSTRSVTDKGYIVDSAGNAIFYAKYAYVLGRTSRSDPQAPGCRITISARETPSKKKDGPNYGAAAGDSIVPRHPLDQPYDRLKYEHQMLAINNPLGLVYEYIDPTGTHTCSVGVTELSVATDTWTTSRDDPLAQVNGNIPPGSYTGPEPMPWVKTGDVAHGSNSDDHIVTVCDRSLMYRLGGLKKFRMARNDLSWIGGSLPVINPLPWDRLPPLTGPNASLDYPDVRGRRLRVVMADTRLDPTQKNVDLRPARPAGPQASEKPVGRNPVSTVVSVPRFQPPNVGDGYVGKVYAYIDSTGDGRLTKPAEVGSQALLRRRVSGARAEAYREFMVQLHVPPDLRVEVVEKTYDIGKVPHGFGLTCQGSQVPGIFYDNLAGCEADFGRWFKSFTAYNLGNVNLLNVKMARLELYSDTVQDPSFGGMGYYIPAQCVVSALDEDFLGDGPPVSPVLGLPTRTFHKARVGEAPTVLRIPDIPKRLYRQFGYGSAAPPPLPSFSVAVPTGTPVGTYSRVLTLFEDVSGDGVFDVPESVGNPIVQAKVTVTEGRLTDGFTPGALPQIDLPQVGGGDPPVPLHVGDAAPAAYRDPTGNLRLFWASSRYGASGSGNDPWYLYTSVLPWATDPFDPNVGQWAFGWTGDENDPQPRWWNSVTAATAYPSPGGVASFFPSPDGANPNRGAPGDLLPSTVKFTSPSIAVDDPRGRAWLFYSGEAFKHDTATQKKSQESRVFYTEMTGGNLASQVFSSTHDWTMPKYGVRGAAARIGKTTSPPLWLWTFWHGGNNNKWSIYYNANQHPEDPDAWTNDTQLSLPRGLTSAAEPSPVFRPITARDSQVFDIVYSGYSQYHKNTDIYLSRYRPRPEGYNRRTGWLPMDLRLLPPIKGEELTRAPASAIWSSKHVDWDTKPANLDVRVYCDANDPSSVWVLNPANAKFTRDRQTRALIYTYEGESEYTFTLEGGEKKTQNERDLRRLFQSAIINPEAGTVKFLRDPGPNARVVVDYIPKAYRLTTDSAADVSPYALLDDDPNPRYNPKLVSSNPFYMPSGYDENNPPPTDRFWVFWRRPAPAMRGTSVFYKSFRHTVRLDPNHRIAVGSSGEPMVEDITPVPSAPVEVDWVKNRLYFTSADEGKQFVIRYVDAEGYSAEWPCTVRFEEELDAQGNAFGNLTSEIVNEGQVCAFKDPMENKLWVFWTSTRSGNTDLYYEAVSPRFYGIRF